MKRKPHVRTVSWNEPTMTWWERVYLFEIMRDEEVCRYLAWAPPAALEETLELIRQARDLMARGQTIAFAQIWNATGRAIGSTRLLDVRPKDRHAEIGSTFVGRPVCAGGGGRKGQCVECEKTTDCTGSLLCDPSTNKWTISAALPIPRDHLGIAVLGGKIHVFGGRLGPTPERSGRHDVYDPATDTWTTAAPLLTPRSAGVSFVQGGRIVYAGGECKDPQTSTTFIEAEVYDPATNKWTALPALPVGRHAGAAVVVGDQAYVIGGNNGCGGNRAAREILTFRLPAS